MNTIIFDTETTGLIKPSANDVKDQPYITEIYCLKIDSEGKIIGEFESLVRPPVSLNAEVQRITGLTDDMLKNAPTFAEIVHALSMFFLGTQRVVAHNLAFDKSMLGNELVRVNKLINFPWPIEHICTVEKSMHYEQRRLNLTRLHEYLFNGQGFPNAHRAKNDVMPLYNCYMEMIKRGDIK